MRAMLLGLSLLIASLWGCEDKPKRDFEDFIDRSSAYRPDPEAEPLKDQSSVLSDIRGAWFIKARLSAGIDLGLRVRFSILNDAGEELDLWPMKEDGSLSPATILTQIWLERHEPLVWLERDDPESDVQQPIVTVMSEVDEGGRFVMVAEPLILDPELLGSDSNVEANVNLSTQTLNQDELCGEATGNVTLPINISLLGSTFYGLRDPNFGLGLSDLDQARCPSMGGEQGGAMAGAMAGVEGGAEGGAELMRPESPDLSAVDTQLGDLSGHWLVNVKTPLLPLKLWASIIFTAHPEGDGGWIEGTLKRDTDPFNAPPLVNFSTLVDAEGRFEIWLPGFALAGAIPVDADLLISGLTLPPAAEGEPPVGWCGAGAGQVRRPAMIPLEGSTLYAHPWVPGEPLPEPLFEACP